LLASARRQRLFVHVHLQGEKGPAAILLTGMEPVKTVTSADIS
jgi:hypothetical protein